MSDLNKVDVVSDGIAALEAKLASAEAVIVAVDCAAEASNCAICGEYPHHEDCIIRRHREAYP